MEISSLTHFWQFDSEYWYKQFNTSEKGLTSSDVEKILMQSGQHKKTKT